MWTVSGSAVRTNWVGSRHLAPRKGLPARQVVGFGWAPQRSPAIAGRFVEFHVKPALEPTRPATSLGPMSGGMDVLANELAYRDSSQGAPDS